MGGQPVQPTLPLPVPDAELSERPPPLLLVDGHNLLWGATFGFPAPVYSRDKTRLLTGVFAFFALLRVAVRDDLPGPAPEVIVVFDGEHGAATRKQDHDGYKASRPVDDEAHLPLEFLADVKRGLEACGITWAEREDAEADDVIVGDACAVVRPDPSVLLCDLIYRLKLDRRSVRPEFAAYSLLTQNARAHLSGSARGTSQSMVKLRGEDIKACPVRLPGLVGQDNVIGQLNHLRDRVGRTAATLSRQIDLLAEHRQALITAAVTGELDVSKAA